MIEFVSGDMFKYDADIRINTVNCVGVMGAGVALLFKNKYPEMFIEYVNACKHHEVKPGNPHVWLYKDLLTSCTIVNFPTKWHWKNPSEYEYIEKGLIWLRKFLMDTKNKTVTIPALGCGHGGLDWDKVKLMIIEYLSDLDLRIFVFEPSSSTKFNTNNENDKELEDKNIFKILPSDISYPEKLVGKSAAELYYKGNIELLKRKKIALIANPKPTDRENTALNKIINEMSYNEAVFLVVLSNSNDIEIAKNILINGFYVILVIPYGLLQFKVRKDLQPLLDDSKTGIVSFSSPNKIWKNYEVLKAIKMIIKISDVILINSINTDNLFQFEKEIEQSNSKVFYVNYWNERKKLFEKIKGQKIGIDSATGKPNLRMFISEQMSL